jgi:hypothetical protein
MANRFWWLAKKADRLFALHGHKNGGAVAVVESQEDEDKAARINAVKGGRQHGADWRCGHLGGRRDGAKAEHRASPSDAAGAIAAKGICYYHGSSTTMPTSARVVPQSPATGRVISHQVVVSRVALMHSPQAVSRPCEWRAAQRRLFNCNAERSSFARQVRQRRAAQVPPLQLQCRTVPHRRTRFTTASCTSAAYSPARQASHASPDQFPRVIFLRSHKLFVDPVESSCRLCRRASCTAQRFGGLLYMRNRRSDVGLTIWPPCPALASPTP